eukprot:TRINITY_DN2526_c0_g1_i4.p2 TRINITY_DN2526_c0_g1~~TRINITY_DN2526_c0_g1_i4.p2  ORF type:complete len:234 (+),score=42.51 TRINITY_DN2526_c0_g1_i4:154-855(+)
MLSDEISHPSKHPRVEVASSQQAKQAKKVAQREDDSLQLMRAMAQKVAQSSTAQPRFGIELAPQTPRALALSAVRRTPAIAQSMDLDSIGVQQQHSSEQQPMISQPQHAVGRLSSMLSSREPILPSAPQPPNLPRFSIDRVILPSTKFGPSRNDSATRVQPAASKELPPAPFFSSTAASQRAAALFSGAQDKRPASVFPEVSSKMAVIDTAWNQADGVESMFNGSTLFDIVDL